MFGSREIGRRRSGDGYIPSFGKHTIFACLAAEKNSPFSEHLLNNTVMILMYSSGSFYINGAYNISECNDLFMIFSYTL